MAKIDMSDIVRKVKEEVDKQLFARLYPDTNILYCPYCGERLESVAIDGKTTCDNCGSSFIVVSEDDG